MKSFVTLALVGVLTFADVQAIVIKQHEEPAAAPAAAPAPAEKPPKKESAQEKAEKVAEKAGVLDKDEKTAKEQIKSEAEAE